MTDDNLCVSTGGAIEPAIKKNCGGRTSKNKCTVKSVNVINKKKKQNNKGQKRMSKRMRNWVKSCLPDPEEENFADGCSIPANPGGQSRRSSRLATRQERIGHHRASCKQKEAQEKVNQAMDRTRAKLRAKDADVLRDMEEEPDKRRSRKATKARREDNTKSASILFELRKAA